jgi:hypothetical protein
MAKFWQGNLAKPPTAARIFFFISYGDGAAEKRGFGQVVRAPGQTPAKLRRA